MRQKIILLISFIFLIVTGANAQISNGDWIAGNSSVSPSSPIPACGTVTASGTYFWNSFTPFDNINHGMFLDYALPSSVIPSTGTPSLVWDSASSIVPVQGAIFTPSAGGWNCQIPFTQSFPPGVTLTFTIANLQIVNTPSFTGQQLTHFHGFLGGPIGEDYTNNASTITFNTIAVPTVTANATQTNVAVGTSITLTGGGALSYTWDSAIVQNGVPFTPPVGTHVYTVTGTDANNCTATSSVTITVNPTTGNWVTGDESVSPSSPIPACSTLTASGSYTWLSFDPFPNDTYPVTLSYVLPSSVDISSGTPTLTDLSNNPIPGAVFAQTATGYECTFAPGTSFAPGTKFIFRISGLEIADSPSFTNQQCTHSISLATSPVGELPGDNSKTAVFSTTAVPTVTANASATTLCAGDSLTLTGTTTAPTVAWDNSVVDGVAFVPPVGSTTYIVTATDANNCTGVDSVTVLVNALPTVVANASSAAVCIGDSVTLTGSGAATYAWDNSVVDGTAFVPAATNTYTVTGTDSNGCVNTASVMVTVNTPLQFNTLVATPSTVCFGDDASLVSDPGVSVASPFCANGASSGADTKIDTVSFAGVSTGSSLTASETYTDYTSVVIPVTAGTSYPLSVRNGSASGNYYGANLFVYIDYDQNGVFDAAELVYQTTGTALNTLAPTTITPPVSAFNGPTRMRVILHESAFYTQQPCGTYTYGETEDYTVNISGGATKPVGFAAIAWSPTANLNTASGDSVVAQGLTATTTFTAIGTDLNGCLDTTTVTVNVTPLPVVTASAAATTLCIGDSTTLTASGADTYVWNPGPLTGTPVTVTPSGATNYIVIGTDTTTGCSGNDTITISNYPAFYVTASASATDICLGDSVNLSAADSVPAIPACATPTTSFGCDEAINIIGFNTIADTSACSSAYVDNTATLSTAVTAGTAYPISVTTNNYYTGDQCNVWVDWNNNGSFLDAGELTSLSHTTGGVFTGSIAVPLNAQNGSLVMRVRMTYTGPNTPCGNATYGETEDYSVVVSGATPPAASTYTWAWMPGSLAGAAQTLNPTASATYTVTQTDSATGCIAMDSVTVNVLATPSLAVSSTPSSALCIGDTLTLMSGAIGADSITWNGVATAGTDTTLVPSTTATYNTSAFNTTTGCSVSDSLTVVVNTPVPFDSIVASATTVCFGDSVAINAYPGEIVSSLYCNSAATSTADTKIDSFSFAGTTTGSAPTVGEFYTDNTAIIIPITAGTSYPLSVQNGSASGNYYGANLNVYIDYNQNRIFEASEEVYATTGTALNTLAPTTITPPLSAFNGLTRMRVILRENATYPFPCGTFTWGEVEEYTVNISGGTAPPAQSFASITWNPTTALSSTTGDAISAQGLTASTVYTATGTDTNGCVSMDSVSIMVNPLPTVTASATPATICPGDTSMLMGTGTATSYVWEPGTLAGANQSVTPTTTTMYTLTGIDSVTGCENTSTATVGVNPAAMLTVTVDSNESCPNSMNGGATALAAPAVVNIFSEGFTGATGTQTAIPNAFAPGWTNSGTGPFWATDNDGGNSSGTGPVSGANTPGYVYLESSTGAGEDTLISPTIDLSTAVGSVDMKFFYHRFGTSLDSMFLLIDNGTTINSVWSIGGQQQASSAAAYDSVMLNLNSYMGQMINLKFVGRRTIGFSNDMAIDDIEVTNNPGPTTILWSTTDTTNTITGLASGVYTVTATNAFGCSAQDSATILPGAASGNLTQATAGNTASTAGIGCGTFVQPNDGLTFSYYDASCNIIASIQEAAGGTSFGSVSACATINATVPTHNGQPFVPRWFEITPTNQGTALVTLYVTQADFDQYNLNSAGWPSLPTGALDAAGIANLRITKNDNGGLGVNPVVLSPTGVTYNATAARWEVTFVTPGFSQFRLHAVNPNNSALPVDYKSFTVTKQATSDLVEWTTVTETYNSHFNIQRSADGQTFENIGTVQSQSLNGNSSSELNYSFVDEQPMIGHNYYRLEQVSLDNRMSYTKVIDIIWGADGSVVSIYPNPTKDILNIDLSTSKVSQTEVKLLDMSGRVVKSVMAQTVKGMNNINFNISDVASGVYGIQIFENNRLTHVSKVRKN